MRKIICFHDPKQENGYLSNWYPCRFTVDGTEFTSMEQYMMYQKAVRFHDKVIADQILETADVAEIKSLGRQVSGYDDHYWSGIRQIVVYKGLYAKFSQNPELKKQLLDTQDSLLAEGAYRDTIWGIGVSINDPACYDPAKWRGKNLLGYALMMVRDDLA